MYPRVSVIIPNYNYGRFLAEAVNSALSQTLAPHEVIVVDDGSTDDSLEVLKGFGDRIRVIRQENQGVGTARNAGAEASQGDYLAFLDADDYWAPEKLEKQAAKFAEDTEIGLVHCGMVNVDAAGRQIDEDLKGEEGWVAEKLLRFKPTVHANALLIRKDIFMAVGGYDTRPELHPSEDWELSYRLALKCKFGFVAEPLLYYRHHGSGGHTNIKRMELAMLLGYEKAFANGATADRRECYGKLHQVLAGSYFLDGKYADFARNAAKSIWMRPVSIGYFLAFPLRRLGNLMQSRKKSSKTSGR